MPKSKLEELIIRAFDRGKKKSDKPKSLVGIYLSKNGICGAISTKNFESKIEIVDYFHFESDDQELIQRELNNFVEKNNLYDFHCCCILERGSYDLGLIETPKVSEKEMTQAIRWAVSEFIDYPPEDVEVDSIELPLVRASDNNSMSYGVAVKKDIIFEIERVINLSGLKLKYIDIEEMGLLNLIKMSKKNDKGYLLLKLSGNSGNTLIVKGNDLCISRMVDCDLSSFLNTNLQAVVANHDDPNLDALAIDVQRTMDYCSSMFRICPAEKIYLIPSNMSDNLIAEYIKKSLDMPVDIFTSSENLIVPENIDINFSKVIMGICASLYSYQGVA